MTTRDVLAELLGMIPPGDGGRVEIRLSRTPGGVEVDVALYGSDPSDGSDVPHESSTTVGVGAHEALRESLVHLRVQLRERDV